MPVMVHAVAARDRPESRQVEMRVLDFQGIESPLQQFKALLDRIITLREFQFAAKAMIAKGVAHSQHLRVQVGMTCPAAWNGEGEAHQIVAMKSPNGLAANLLADHEHAQ